MNNTNSHYEDKICEAIEYIVENAVSKAEYDKTIQATIAKVVDQTIGKYSVKYQDSVFYAYASSADIKYTKGTDVYVLIPGNDTSRDKTILGSVKKLGVNYTNNPEGEEAFEVIGNNCIKNPTEFAFCSYEGEQLQVVYDREKNIDKISLDIASAEVYIKQSSNLLCGGTFRTALPSEQQIRGNYGISFELAFSNSSGEINLKNYLVDINYFRGNPYRLDYATRQYAIFDIDGENFQYINKISLFVSNFPNIAIDKPHDIFIKSLEFSAVDRLSTEALSSYSLSFITPQGTFFDATHGENEEKTIQAQVRIKGKAIDNDSQRLNYYWFIENAAINYMNEKYNRYGGPGWECINQYTVVKPGENGSAPVVEWVPADYEIKIIKENFLGKERKYKCVAIYDETVVSREITITNLAATYELTIESSEGNQFYFDVGNPTLTCKINGEERLEGYTYSWGRMDSNGIFTTLIPTKENMTIDNNKVYNFYIGDIVTFAIIKCSVSYNDNYLGTAEITLLNSLERDEDDLDYSLIINDGTQVFKYNEAGISPANGSLEVPMRLLPLSFSLYNEFGELIPITNIENNGEIQWIVPTKNTLLVLSDVPGSSDITNTDNVIYKNRATINYLIRDLYDASRGNNNIELIVKYNDSVFSAMTNFSFLKEGDNGTNGTEYVCKIVPNAIRENSSEYPMIINGEFIPELKNKEAWFNVQLWHNGEKIFEDNKSNTEKDIKVKWSILKNKYTSEISDATSIEIKKDELTQEYILFNYTGYQSNAANIIKCELTYKDLTYYATLPLITASVNEGYENIKLKDYSGFRYAVYTADGRRPQYSTNPFELENVEGLTQSWNVIGSIYNGETWENYVGLEVYNESPLEYRPIDEYSGYCVNNALECVLNDESGIEVGRVHIPIHLMLNRYGHASMNGWDGNSIDINNDGGFILAPQVGAGRKESDNSFTGIFMGEVKEAGKIETEVGLFGYAKGQRSMFLNAENGTAIFGSDSGQIIIDPTKPIMEIDENGDEREVVKNPAMLYSVNYWKNYDDNGLPTRYSPTNENKQGLLIDLSTPRIKYGSGNFSVDKDGNLTAKNANITGTIHAENGGTIGGWSIVNGSLQNSDGSIKINPTTGITVGTGFSVTPTGDITLSGSINWGDNNVGGGVQKIYALYARDKLSTPNGSYSSFPETSASGWHKTLDSTNDYYVSYSYDDGNTWTAALKLQGEDGENGENGSNANVPSYIKSTYIDKTSIASPDIYGGMFYATGKGSSDGPAYYIYNGFENTSSSGFTPNLGTKLGYISYDDSGAGTVNEAKERIYFKAVDKVAMKIETENANLSITAGNGNQTYTGTNYVYFGSRILCGHALSLSSSTGYGTVLPDTSKSFNGQIFFLLES